MDESGVSLRAHLQQVERATGRAPPELVGECALPPALAHVWEWFCELSNARPAGFYAVAPLSYEAMESWARLTGHRPTPAEVALLRRLDDAFREAMRQE